MSTTFSISSSVVGLDIGGANIKVSDGQRAESIAFPLWKSPEQLSDVLTLVLKRYPQCHRIAVTMTGELADCFATKREGVKHILSSVTQSAGTREIMVWQTGGEFFTFEEALAFPQLVAAANWHALATWAGRLHPQGTALLVDIGSTTSDLIPIENGIPLPDGRTDVERLRSSELVYLGVRRTPLCAVAEGVSLEGVWTPLAKELFSTTLDVGLITDHIGETPDLLDTANARPATRAEALQRLARAFCGDLDELESQWVEAAASVLLDHMVTAISQALITVCGGRDLSQMRILTSGEGEFLANLALARVLPPGQAEVLSLSQLGGPGLSTAACAYALAILGSEQPVPYSL